MEIPRFRPTDRDDLSGGPDPLALLAAWWRAVGGPMAAAASPRGLSRNRLLVAVPDAPWKREVAVHLEEILSRLRRTEGLRALEGIDLVVEPAPSRSPSLPGNKTVESAPPEPPPEIASSAESIPDRDLARRWKAAVGLLLARREKDRVF